MSSNCNGAYRIVEECGRSDDEPARVEVRDATAGCGDCPCISGAACEVGRLASDVAECEGCDVDRKQAGRGQRERAIDV